MAKKQTRGYGGHSVYGVGEREAVGEREREGERASERARERARERERDSPATAQTLGHIGVCDRLGLLSALNPGRYGAAGEGVAGGGGGGRARARGKGGCGAAQPARGGCRARGGRLEGDLKCVSIYEISGNEVYYTIFEFY